MIRNSLIKLREFTEEDRNFYTQIYSDKSLMKHISIPLDKTACYRSFDLILKKMATDNFNLKMYVIIEINSETKVGIISLRSVADEIHVSEIGVIILSAYQRQGLAHQAKSLLIKETFAITSTKTIIAICEQANKVANHANIKLGFNVVDKFIDKQNNNTKIKWQIKKQEIQ